MYSIYCSISQMKYSKLTSEKINHQNKRKSLSFCCCFLAIKTGKISSNFQNKTKTEKTEKVQKNCRNVNSQLSMDFSFSVQYRSGWRLEIAFPKTDATN